MFPCCPVAGIMFYRMTPNMSKPTAKKLHAVVNLLSLIFTVVALVAVFKALAFSPNKVYSLHSWVGMAAVVLFASQVWVLNTLGPRQKWQNFADDIFKRVFLKENVCISIEFSLKFVLKGPINNIQVLVQIMAWCRPGDKPSSEPMMVSLRTHICVAQPQWVNSMSLNNAICGYILGTTLAQVMFFFCLTASNHYLNQC